MDALNQLLGKFEVVTQYTPPPEQGGDPGVIITGLNITGYNEFQFGEVTSFLQNPNENSEFTKSCAILSATDFVYNVIDCISNVRGKAQSQDACNLIIGKALGIVEYLKGRYLLLLVLQV